MTESNWPSISPEKRLASTVIQGAAAELSRNLDLFSGWLLAGFGAVLGLVIANIDSISVSLPPERVFGATKIFIWAAGLALVAKYLSLIVVTARSVGDQAAASTEKLLSQEPQALAQSSFSALFSEIEGAFFYPAKWYMRWNLRKIHDGDFVHGARLLMKIAQFQSVLVLTQSILHLASAVFLISGEAI